MAKKGQKEYGRGMNLFKLFAALALCAIGYAAPPKVVFAPDRELITSLVELIDAEQKSIKIAVDQLSNRDLVTALIRAKERGVAVEIIVDRSATSPRLPIHGIASAGIPVYVYDAPVAAGEVRTKAKPHMHHKFCLFGNSGGKGKLLWTGTLSLAYKRSKANRENVVLFSEESVVSGYEREFAEIKRGASKSLKEFLTK